MRKYSIKGRKSYSGKAKFTSFVLASTLILTAGCYGVKKLYINDKIRLNENMDNVVSIDNINKEIADVVLLNMGNYKDKGKNSIEDIKLATDSGLDVGLIINSRATHLYEMANDVEYAKYLVSNNDITYPVYIDIDDIVNNDKLDIKEMLELISFGCSKLTSNNIYAGIAGSRKNIRYLIDNQEITTNENKIFDAYDVLLLDDDEKIKCDCNSKIVKCFKNTYVAQEDLSQDIESKGLNKKEGFLLDDLYKVNEDDTFETIAEKYQITVDDLLKYNDLSIFSRIKNVEYLRIPTSYLENEYLDLESDEINIGFDISVNQSNINWSTLNENASFVIMKATEGLVEDEKFETNYKNALEYDIPVGVYCFSMYSGKVNNNSSNDYKSLEQVEYEQTMQAEYLVEKLKGKKIDCPVYLDYELCPVLSDEQCVLMLDIWYNIISKSGFTPGIYASYSVFSNFKNAYDLKYGEGTFEEKFSTWVAGDVKELSYGYNSELSCDSFMDNLTSFPTELSVCGNYDVGTPDIYQISSKGEGFGASNSSGYVDVNVSYGTINGNKNVITLENNQEKLLEVKSPEQKINILKMFKKLITKNVFITGVACGSSIIISCGIINKCKRKIKRR